MAVTNFEHLHIGIQAHDLYYFLRKIMEKYIWKQKTGQKILDAYESDEETESHGEGVRRAPPGLPGKILEDGQQLLPFQQGLATSEIRRKTGACSAAE